MRFMCFMLLKLHIRLYLLFLSCMWFHLVAAQTIWPLPETVRDGDAIHLMCGRIYSGQLQLARHTDITVDTVGKCGKAVITPAQPVHGWQRDRHKPQIWYAEITFNPVQFEMDGKFLALAHYPNQPQTWAQGKSRLAGQLQVTLPNQDVAGATLVWRAEDWLIQTRTIQRYEASVLYLAPGADEGFGLPAETSFYLEGKRWMIDTPGEWAVSEGRIWVWSPDGRSPEGRAWAAPRAMAIDATDSVRLRIQGIRIHAASLGINGAGSQGLVVTDTDIIHSGEEAIVAGTDTRITHVHIQGAVQNGIRANDDARRVRITDSLLEDVGMLGMPRRSKGAIVFEQADTHTVQRNQIRNAAYLGIRVFRNAIVTDNVIEKACQRLSDCGGIYTFARDRLALNTLIARNRISHLSGRYSYAVYLDDFSNGVRVQDNIFTDNPGGIEIHNGFDNLISGNHFIRSRYEQLLLNETSAYASMANNRLMKNTFTSLAAVPTYRLWSHQGGAHLRRFADFEGNHYTSLTAESTTDKNFAELEGQGLISYKLWSKAMSDETQALSSDAPPIPKLTRQR